MTKPLVFLTLCSLVAASWAPAAPAASNAAPRVLTYADCASFRTILSPTLSRDGRWLATVEMPQEGDGEVVIQQVDTGRTWRAAVGATPPPPFPQPTSPTEKRPKPQRPTVAFTGDSAYLLTHTLPSRAQQVAAREKKTKTKPARNLIITTLATGTMETVERVKSLQVSAQSGSVVAYLVETTPPKEKPADPTGDTLYVRDLASGRHRTIKHVTDFTLSRDGRTLAYTTATKPGRTAKLMVYDPTQRSSVATIYTGPGAVSKLTWDLGQTQLAFLCTVTSARKKDPPPPQRSVQVWSRGAATARMVVDATTPGVPAGMIVSDKAALRFTLDGKKLALGVAPPPAKYTPPADPEDRVDLDLWSWNDDLIQPRQAVCADEDKNRSYPGLFDLATQHYQQLGTPEMPDVLISDNGTRAVAVDYRPYYRLRDYDATYGDIYLLDPTTGKARKVLTKLRGGTGDEGETTLRLSPNGRLAAYWEDRQWHVLDLDTGEHHSLTTNLPHPVYDELHDQPEPPPAAGFGGWTEDSQSVLVYDRYDLWQVFPDGRPARDLTHGYGRAHQITLRRQDFSPREPDDPRRGADLSGPLLVHGEDQHTRATGFLRFMPGQTEPQKLLWGDCAYAYAGRALAADRLLLTIGRFDQFPDVWLTDENLDQPRRLTDGQAQVNAFKWGHAELIDYRNSAGVPLQACVYLPPDFDPHKKYPLIVYTYERLSQIIHRFFAPTPGSNISFPIYVSNGYIVMLADLTYKVGHPGASALDCINAALDAVEARGFVDEKALGYQGSSWGGYTAAYLLTHSDRFAAIEGGALVSNMTSAYGGIRLYSGQPRLFQYEQSQSRIGRSLADGLDLYLENSPLFQVKNAHAPMLMLHNDRDGAVPFEQSVEFFLSLRRYDKPAWLFNYHDDGHGVSRLANRKDFSRRMWQFYDHFLRGAPAPDWLVHGVPYLQRDQEKLTFDAPPKSAGKSH